MPAYRTFSVLLVIVACLAGGEPLVRIHADGPHGFRFAGLYAIADGQVTHPGLNIQVTARMPGRSDASSAQAWRFGAGDPSEGWARGGDRLLVCAIPTGLLPGIVQTGPVNGLMQSVRIDPELPPSLRRRGQVPSQWPAPSDPSWIEWWGVWPADVAALAAQGPVQVVLAPGAGTDGWEFLTVAGEIARAHPERVDAVRRAVLDGWTWVAAHPTEAMELVERRADAAISRSVLRAEAEAVLSGLPADPSGTVSPAWITAHDQVLADAGLAGRWQRPQEPVPTKNLTAPAFFGVGVLIVSVIGALILALRWRQRYRRDQEHQTDRILRARTVQTGIMPGLPQLPGLTVSLHDEPSAGIGGDFYVCGLCGPDRWVVLLGDVSGKDVQAAFIATAAVKEIQHCLAKERSLPALMVAVDQGLRPHLQAGSLITLLAVAWEPDQSRVTVLRAGHLPAVLCRSDGSWSELGRSAPAIGVGRGWSDDDLGQAELGAGDAILMLTDGVTETMSAQADFGLAGAVGALHGLNPAAHPDVATRVVDAARRFAGGRLDDDATAVILTRPR